MKYGARKRLGVAGMAVALLCAGCRADTVPARDDERDAYTVPAAEPAPDPNEMPGTNAVPGTDASPSTRGPAPGSSVAAVQDPSWQSEFAIEQCELLTVGGNDFFVLQPGFQLVLESAAERLVITVLDETSTVDGVETRIVEEREWRGDRLIEVSRNFFATCAATDDVFYFGEEVDDYVDGEAVGHAGEWLAGEDGARAGLIMPATPSIGMRYFQEVAPEVAMDRAEVVSLTHALETPAGTFSDCLRTQEGSALKPGEREFKTYAPGIGLIQDQSLLLVAFGYDLVP